ncbi:MAG: hypothetical protein U1E59_03610 [Amaricoccus sp.]
MSVYINISVSLILVYLIVSLVVTACNEIISTLLKTRPRMLVQTIVQIIGDDELLRRFYGNGIIAAASDSSTAGRDAWKPAGLRERLFGKWMEPRSEYERGHPSYIEGKNFAKALGMAVMGWSLDEAAARAQAAGDTASAVAARAAADAALNGTDPAAVAAAAIATAQAIKADDPSLAPACDRIVATAGTARTALDLDAAKAQAKAAADLATARIVAAAVAAAGVVRESDPALAEACDKIIADAGIAQGPVEADARAKAAATLAAAAAGGVPTVQGIAKAVGDLPDGALRDVLRSALTGVGNDLDGFEKAVSAWYDTTQARLSGAYARYQKYVALAFGALLALLLNVDSLQIAQRASLTADHLNQETFDAAEAEVSAGVQSNCKVEGDAQTRCIVGEAMDRLTSIDPLLVSWTEDEAYNRPTAGLWVYKVAGLLLTTLAVSLGAPFWFDLLSMFVNIRGAGPKPEDKPAK